MERERESERQKGSATINGVEFEMSMSCPERAQHNNITKPGKEHAMHTLFMCVCVCLYGWREFVCNTHGRALLRAQQFGRPIGLCPPCSRNILCVRSMRHTYWEHFALRCIHTDTNTCDTSIQCHMCKRVLSYILWGYSHIAPNIWQRSPFEQFVSIGLYTCTSQYDGPIVFLVSILSCLLMIIMVTVRMVKKCTIRVPSCQSIIRLEFK